MTKYLRLISSVALIALVSIFLSACQSNNFDGKSFDSLSKEQKKTALLSLKELQESGKLGIISRLNNKRFSINFNYHNIEGAYNLELFASLGMTVAKVDVKKNGTTFLETDGKVIKGDSPSELLKDQFNIDVPVEDLHNILLGIPSGDVSYDKDNYPIRAQRGQDYIVNYNEYRATRGGFKLPSNIEVITPYSRLLINVRDIERIN